MEPGRPSVALARQLVHIWGTSWTHHRMVPMVPRTVAAAGMEACGAMVVGDNGAVGRRGGGWEEVAEVVWMGVWGWQARSGLVFRDGAACVECPPWFMDHLLQYGDRAHQPEPARLFFPCLKACYCMYSQHRRICRLYSTNPATHEP